MLKVLKRNIFFLKAIKTKQKYHNIFPISFKQNKKRLLLLIPENIGDRAFSMRKSRIPTNFREEDMRCFKN